jgi:hypothetical protein
MPFQPETIDQFLARNEGHKGTVKFNNTYRLLATGAMFSEGNEFGTVLVEPPRDAVKCLDYRIRFWAGRTDAASRELYAWTAARQKAVAYPLCPLSWNQDALGPAPAAYHPRDSRLEVWDACISRIRDIMAFRQSKVVALQREMDELPAIVARRDLEASRNRIESQARFERIAREQQAAHDAELKRLEEAALNKADGLQTFLGLPQCNQHAEAFHHELMRTKGGPERARIQRALNNPQPAAPASPAADTPPSEVKP